MDPIDETTDGPDPQRAQKELRDARVDRRRTEAVVKAANEALRDLRRIHDENHFVDKIRSIWGVPT